MGMSIENCKKRLVIEKELAIKTGLNHDANGTLADAIDVAIDTMRKYQKIVQIMERTVDDGTSMYDTLQEIEAVIKDGSN